MSVTERVQAAGSWELELSPETPRSLLEAIDVEARGFSQLVILPTHVDPREHSDATLLSLARWSGIYRRQEGLRLSGPGSAILLEDEDGKGDIFETDRSTVNGYLTQWVTALRPLSLFAGTTYSPGGSFDASFKLISAREALTKVGDYFDVEWRVTPGFALDVGHPDALYGATPKLIVLHNAGDGGRDINITGVMGGADMSRDLEDYTTRIVYVTEETVETNTEVVTGQGAVGGNVEYDAVSDMDVVTSVWQDPQETDTITERDVIQHITTAELGTVPYGRPTGGPVILDRLIDASSQDEGSDPQHMADMQLARFDQVRRELTAVTAGYDIGHIAPVGSPVWLYSPPVLMDLANPVQFRGQVCYPIKTRILGMTWPIVRGYGVYLRTHEGGGVWRDLTNYVIWEDGDVKLEVGALPRSSG